jgi:ATP-dependent DNA helicase DinG
MDVLEILGPDGPVAARLDHYEERPEQSELAAAVDDVMRRGGRLMAEAGTGVGKSFAYLVPAIAAAADRSERVVIATHTIALQEQLLGKDVPFLTGILPAEFSVVLAKGRGNFLCQRRMWSAVKGGKDLFDGQGFDEQLERIVKWSEKTDDGTLQDLPFVPAREVWNKVNAEAGNCLGRACQFYEPCFYQAGRRRLANANIVVANHHFLFADMALRRVGWNLIPDFEHLVLDEAHGVEDVAGEYLGLGVSRGMVRHLLRMLASTKGKGVLHTVDGSDEAIEAVRTARDASDGFFMEVSAWVRAGKPKNGRIHHPELFPRTLALALDDLGGAVQRLANREESPEKRQELTARAARAGGLADELRALIGLERQGHVYWAEEDSKQNVSVRSSPVDVGPELGEHLWKPLKSVTLTSATLSTGGEAGFRHLASRLGVQPTRTLLSGSPFDFRTQARLVVDRRVPNPQSGDAYEDALPDVVLRYVQESEGGVFVLFTSYQSLDRCHAVCLPSLRADGYVVFKQGDGLPRAAMLEQFKEAGRAVLFGTDSFWQGVDVPGDALTTVIITRLPFAVPTHPVQEARTQAIERAGGNAFGEYSLPQAILKFKQGFGRLIRSKRDRGTVVVLDERVVTKRYGRGFLEALPDIDLEVVER